MGYATSRGRAYDGRRLLAWSFHIRLLFGARQLGTVAACALALFVVVAQPVASLAWLGGAHATPEQAALHDEAVEAGLPHHHGESGHRAHEPPRGSSETDAHVPQPSLGQDFASAAPHAGLFQNLLQALSQGMLATAPDTPSPGDPAGGASLAEDLPSQHSPPVPHRPPILLLPTIDVL
jgi:hypothetical protein